MSNRRVSSDRPRWSQESGASEEQEEVLVFNGNRMLQPFREPVNAPIGKDAQKEAGFARFLRKHSSPSHQRVTAGGRIVPMEQRPPAFTLPTQPSGIRLNGEPAPSSPPQPFPYLTPTIPGNASADVMTPTSPIAFGPGFTLPPVSAYPFGLVSPLVYPIPLQYGQTLAMLGLPPSATDSPLDAQISEQAHAEMQLHTAIASFEDYDRQLKSLDRHRAMQDRPDPFHFDQRKAIVDLRGQTRQQIAYWSAQIGLDPKTIKPESTTSTLNVRAASYVPMVHQQIASTSRDSFESYAQNNGQPDFVVDNVRRPIPIVAPTVKAETSPPKVNAEVDEWGVQTGPAPPEIQRQQTEMVKQMNGLSPLKSAELISFASAIVSPECTNGFKPVRKMNFDDTDWPVNPGRPSPVDEAFWRSQLDAMRQPKGTVTEVKMHDGTVMEVKGIDLQHPPSAELDSFERDYWGPKTVDVDSGKFSVTNLNKIRYVRAANLMLKLILRSNPKPSDENVNGNGYIAQETVRYVIVAKSCTWLIFAVPTPNCKTSRVKTLQHTPNHAPP
jgi:hypothetical protein